MNTDYEDRFHEIVKQLPSELKIAVEAISNAQLLIGEDKEHNNKAKKQLSVATKMIIAYADRRRASRQTKECVDEIVNETIGKAKKSIDKYND